MNVELKEREAVNVAQLADQDLLRFSKQGNRYAIDILIERYRNFVWVKARTYFLIGGDREDIIQEGMIGLFKAIRDFDETKLASFKGFAELCVTRQIITAIKTATRQKHIPLNSYISLDKPIYDQESERTLLDMIAGSRSVDPQERMIIEERQKNFDLMLYKVLSEFERQVLYLYLDGRTYVEMAEQMNRSEKSIDNALQRVKRKFEQVSELNTY